MPASEQTWRDTKLLHKVFAVSSVIMLVATIWMFVKDHSRSWKPYQRQIGDVESRMTNWRQLQFATNAALAEHDRLTASVLAARTQAIDVEVLQDFIDTVSDDDTTRQYSSQSQALTALATEFSDAAAALDSDASEDESAAVAEKRDDILTRMNSIIASLRTREETQLGILKFARADRDKAVADVGLALRDDEPLEEQKDKQAAADQEKANVQIQQGAYDALKSQRKELESIVAKVTAAETAASEALAKNGSELEQLRTANVERRLTYVNWLGPIPLPGKKWLEMPILDAFNSPRKIDNLWSEGLMIEQGSFGKVRRFDRCTTCHQSIQKTVPGSASDPAYQHEHDIDFVLVADALSEEDAKANLAPAQLLEKYYGIMLAAEGLIDRDDVTIQYVRNESAAAKATAIGAVDVQSGAEIRKIQLQTKSADGRVANGLVLGDVIAGIDGDRPIRDPKRVLFRMLDAGKAGQPLTLTIKRGLPGPFTSHPRLDLFIGSLSPHKMSDFACTVCHDGQGSATDFKWASHTPTTERDRKEWAKKYGWFDNHHWIMPMHPKRFAEASCLKCHHQVTELEPSEKFPDPPAPKVVHGYNLIRKYGCYGCHEINGFDAGESVGPDMRLEPNFFAAALQLGPMLPSGFETLAATKTAVGADLEVARPRADIAAQVDALLSSADVEQLKALSDDAEAGSLQRRLAGLALPAVQPDLDAVVKRQLTGVAREELRKYADAVASLEADLAAIAQRDSDLRRMIDLADRLAKKQEDAKSRHLLFELMTIDDARSENGDKFGPTLSLTVRALMPLLKDVESAGVVRKPGPSLRYASRKLDPAFMFDWIRDPKNFRPTTRMPKFFGLWSHLDDHGHGDIVEGFEPLEVLGITTYLQRRSQPFEYLEPPADLNLPPLEADGQEVAALPPVERGRIQFQERCLACHTHDGFPDTAGYRGENEIVQGPDLSGIGDKLKHDLGEKWLYSWIKQPSRYHVRTVMPDLFLDPVEPSPTLFAKLAPPKQPGAEEAVPEGPKPIKYQIDPAADITAFLMTSSTKWSPKPDTLVSPQDADPTKLDELVLENLKDAFAEAAARRYLGLTGTGAAGIPADMREELKGAEVELVVDGDGVIAHGKLTRDAKLLYLGRKAIGKYGCYGCHDIPGFEDAKPIGTALADWGLKDPTKLAFEHITHHLDHQRQEGHHMDDGETAEMHDFYHHQIAGGHRAGFIYQKLREPRSYDYHKVENKKYNERLRMPQFPFSAQEREAVITFVLGLVADPPAEKYIYQPNERQKALIEGRQVLDKYNCGGCHLLEAASWDLAFEPGRFNPQGATDVYPFLASHFTPEELVASAKTDVSGLVRATIDGMPRLADVGPDRGIPMVNDSLQDPLENDDDYDVSTLEFPFDLWSPALLDGNAFEVGVLPLNPKASEVATQRSSRGGFLAKYLARHVVKREMLVNSAAKGTEVWGWLPPPLMGEGKKVQTGWLHDFLLNPYRIRPATVLRMPRFNMSAEEATKLVNYFAARDNAEYPYESSERQQASYLASEEAAYQQKLAAAEARSSRFADAMGIVTSSDYCVKCHSVGDFDPESSDRGKAPNLAEVGRRLRPDYLRNWIAKPNSVLPYTSMPVNVPYKPGVSEFRAAPAKPVLYHGTSIETVDALVDLLLNFDKYSKQRSPIRPLVTGEPTTDPTDAVVPSPVGRTTPPKPSTPTPSTPAPDKKELPAFLKNLPQATGWGHLKVRFVYDGDSPVPKRINADKDPQFCGKFPIVDESVVVNPENGGLANVIGLLDLRASKVKVTPIHESYRSKALDDVVLDNNKCRFAPHVALLWTPQTLILKNSDTVGHNTNYSSLLSNAGDNPIIPGGASVSVQLENPERRPSPISCNIHPWMKAQLVVKSSPYMAVSDKNGELSIANLPAGKWTFQFNHEESGYVGNVTVDGKATSWARGNVEVEIKDGETSDLGVVKFAPR